MYKKILVPLDGSEISESILDHVVTIATGCQVPEVILVRVRQPLDKDVSQILDPHIAKDLDETYEEEAGRYLGKIAAKLRKKGVAVKTVVLSGNPAEKIIEYSHNSGVELIIMSTHGRSGISRWVLGSVADKIIRQSEVPVLIKPAGIKAT
jgi:nucleotide-binding universal stress UspA family protein